MADGDIVFWDAAKVGYKLMDAHNGSSAGPWVEVPPQYCFRSVHCDVAGTDTVNIEVSNALVLPLGTTSGAVYGQLTGTNGTTTSTLLNSGIWLHRWVRAVKAGTSNTSTVVLYAARPL